MNDQSSKNIDNENTESDQFALNQKIKNHVVNLDKEEDDSLESHDEETKPVSNQTSSLSANLSKRRYITRTDGVRATQAAITAATNDPYELKEVMARGAEAVLYRSVCGAFTFCAKAIRNNWNKILGTSSGKAVEKLDNVSYRTKMRHIQNEFEISQMLNEEGTMPIVRIYALRKVTRFGVELGYDLLMEYLSGHDLGDKVLNKVLPLEDKVRVMYQATQALAFLHKKKIIHLDIKPSNFMLIAGKVKLIDFGVSVMCGHQSKAITGTGGYLSPEQICKDTIDERTDIFALGVALSVFMGGQPLSQPQEELLTHQAREEARMHMNQSDFCAVTNVPGLTDMPLIAEAVRSCTIMRRDKRVPSCNALLAKFREAAEKYGIILN